MPRGHIKHFYRIDERDDELSRSSNGIIENWAVQLITLHCTVSRRLSISSHVLASSVTNMIFSFA